VAVRATDRAVHLAIPINIASTAKNKYSSRGSGYVVVRGVERSVAGDSAVAIVVGSAVERGVAIYSGSVIGSIVERGIAVEGALVVGGIVERRVTVQGIAVAGSVVENIACNEIAVRATDRTVDYGAPLRGSAKSKYS